MCAYARRVILRSACPSNSWIASADAPELSSRDPYERRKSWNTAGGSIFAAAQAARICRLTVIREMVSNTGASSALSAATRPSLSQRLARFDNRRGGPITREQELLEPPYPDDCPSAWRMYSRERGRLSGMSDNPSREIARIKTALWRCRCHSG